MHVAVVIVAYRNPSDVVRCVNALLKSDYTDFEIVICENGGSQAADELRSLTSSLQTKVPIHVIAADNPGFPGGVNRGMAASPEADAWWVLNPDTIPDPGALEALVRRLSRGDVHAAGGVVLFPSGQVQGSGGVWSNWLSRAKSLREAFSTDSETQARQVEARQNYLLGTSMLISKEFLKIAGPMREDYFLYAEEIEWCLRGLARGARLGHAPDARVTHFHGTTTGSGAVLNRRPRFPIYLDERNKLHVVRDTQPKLLPIAAVCALALQSRFLVRRAPRQYFYALQGWFAGVRNERGKPRWLS